MSRRSLLYDKNSIPNGFILVDEVPDYYACYAMFTDKEGTEWCVPAEMAIASENRSWWSTYTFVAPVVVADSDAAVRKMIVSPYEQDTNFVQWSSLLLSLPNIPLNTDSYPIINNFNGQQNTKTVLDYFQGSESYVPVFFDASKRNINGRACYVPSGGEFSFLAYFAQDINNLLQIGGYPTYPVNGYDYYWISAQYSSSYAWIGTLFGDMTRELKNNTRRKIFVAPLAAPYTGGVKITYSGAWTLNSEGYHESNTIADGEETILQINLEVTEASTVRLWYYASSEQGYDIIDVGYLDHTIDWGYLGYDSGNHASSDAKHVDYDLSVGTHYIQTRYRKDYSSSSYNDKGYVKVEIIS